MHFQAEQAKLSLQQCKKRCDNFKSWRVPRFLSLQRTVLMFWVSCSCCQNSMKKIQSRFFLCSSGWRTQESGLTVNLTKCEFARVMVMYLSRVVGQGMFVGSFSAEKNKSCQLLSYTFHKKGAYAFFGSSWILQKVL